jgi:hypothetical protein
MKQQTHPRLYVWDASQIMESGSIKFPRKGMNFKQVCRRANGLHSEVLRVSPHSSFTIIEACCTETQELHPLIIAEIGLHVSNVTECK